jgi:siroheme synthase-like protein
MNALFPVFLKLKGRRALVVGGGTIATLRVEQLLRAGARVTVTAPEVSAEIEAWAKDGSVQLFRHAFQPGKVSGRYFVVIAATGDPAVQAGVARLAERQGALLNVVDNPELSTFYTPAVVHRGDLTIAIGTSGQSPFLAGRLREWLEAALPENAEDLTQVLSLLRSRLKFEIPHDLEEQKRLLNDFLEGVWKK